MNGLDKILKESSIDDIYRTNNGTSIVYQIPIYQRNYAWEREEIHALIKDVVDSQENNKDVYYIGTLVTYKRDDNVYEVIDGQQRLTTIYLILKALNVDNMVNRLTYTARKRSAETLNHIANIGETETDNGILHGYQYAKDGLEQIIGNDASAINIFKDYFLNHVHIIHYRVPKDVDLNHYFEVMNSRGEQLEKHEIVKAQLSEKFIDDECAMRKFSRVWEACSDMNFYIQQKLSDMVEVFGKTLEGFNINSFEQIPDNGNDYNEGLGTKSIKELLYSSAIVAEKGEENDKNDQFQPIIDFPNFLLIVLKITRMQEQQFDPLKFTLDDKELLSEFSKVSITKEFVEDFTYNMLLARYYLDNYVIHHTTEAEKAGENPWKLQYWAKENKSARPKDLYPNDKEQDEMIQLLSMFEVAFTPKQRKNYLFYCLHHLFKDGDLKNYVQFMRYLADKYFYDVYLDADKLNENNQPKPNAFDETIIQNQELYVIRNKVERNFDGIYPIGSCNIPLYVFNYTDYKIWKKYLDGMRNKDKSEKRKGSSERCAFFEDLGCSDFDLVPFNHFYFSRTRKSLEHYYPQAKAGDGCPIDSTEINCFGNFAMIGSEANSMGSNWNPIDKRNRYLDSKSNQVSVASLKFRIMLQKCQDNYDEGVKDKSRKRNFGMEWNVEDMKQHQEKMLKIIM